MKHFEWHVIHFCLLAGLLVPIIMFGTTVVNAEQMMNNDELQYNYTADINNEMEIISKYEGTVLYEECESLEEQTDNNQNKKLIAEVDKALESKAKSLAKFEKNNEVKKVSSSTENSTNTSKNTKYQDSSKRTIDLNKSSGKKSETTSITSSTGGTLKWGSKYDGNVTKSSIKNSDAIIAKDNAGNTYTKGAKIDDFVITGYCTKCNSPSGSRTTSSGRTATSGISVAVNSSQIKLGTKIIIGDHVYVADDRHGNNNYSHVVDIFFGDETHHGEEPLIKNIPVYIAIEND